MMCFPSVVGVELAWLPFGCRFTLGSPLCAVCSHRIFPVFLSRQITFHSYSTFSSTGAMSPYSPTFSPCLSFSDTAVVTKTRSCHTIGLECASPAIVVFHLMFFPLAASHDSGVANPSDNPDAPGPRNDGHFTPPAPATRAAPTTIIATLVNIAPPIIDHPLPQQAI